MVTEIFPILQPIIRMLPRRLSGFKQEVGRLIDLERKLWISLLDTAKLRIKEGKANHCEYLWHACQLEPRAVTKLMVGNQIAFATDMLVNNESDKMDSLTYLQRPSMQGTPGQEQGKKRLDL